MKKFHARRLLKLAAFLEKVKRRQFDIRRWCAEDACGTVACVGGWAGLMPAFRRLGFKSGTGQGIEFRPRAKADKSYVQEVHNQERKGYPSMPSRAARQFYGFQACERFFGVWRMGLSLFSTGGYDQGPAVTPREAAKRLRHVVKQYHPEVYREYLAKKRAAKVGA
jgi:hypothetical protein